MRKTSPVTTARRSQPVAIQATPSPTAGGASTYSPLESVQPSVPPPQRRQPERLAYTRTELAKASGLCEKTIANHEYPRGNLRFIKIGERGKRYLAADVQAWLASLRSGEPQSECQL